MRRLLTALAILVPVVALALVSAPRDSAVAAGNSRFGVVQAYEAFPAAQQLGIGWQRMHFWWDEAQPNGAADWKPFTTTSDADIAYSRAQGIEVVGVIGTPPAWAVTRSGSVPAGLEQPTNAWASFVGKLAAEYKGRVDHWIVWNEPDISPGQPGSTWGGDDGEYYWLLKHAYTAIKKANPNAKVGFAGTTWWADASRNTDLFIERVIRFGRDVDPSARANGYYFDFAPIHIYTNAYQMHDTPNIYRNILAKYGIPDKPLWIAESNVIPADDPVAPLPMVPGRATQQDQANFMIQGIALAMASGVERIAPYKMRDSIRGNFGEPFGLVRDDFSTRPAYTAYQVAIKQFGDMGQGTWKKKPNHHEVVFRQGKRQVTVLWNPNGADTTTQTRIVGTAFQVLDKAGNVKASGTPNERGFSVQFNLNKATAHDGGPINSIGGDPFILVETGVGDGLDLRDNRFYYPITGYAIGGAFLDYYRRRGGLDTFGYPRSDEQTEDGRIVQYFQRARMEYDPDRAARGDAVQLSLLNDILQAGTTFPKVAEVTNTPTRRYYKETGQILQGPFLTYFDARGGAEIFGLPISGEIGLPGKTIQHFQRGRMELENGRISLALVGDEFLVKRGVLKLD